MALKTAQPGLLHKSDHDGVRLDLLDEAAVCDAYANLAGRFGPKVLVAAMAEPGVEMLFGMIQDEQFGPLVMVGMGGVLAEVMGDVRFALPPFGVAQARRMIDGLAGCGLLGGPRNTAAADVCALAHALSRFSVLVDELASYLHTVDVNPVIAGADGVMAVDTLIIPRNKD